jgi:hypothetical protein
MTFRAVENCDLVPGQIDRGFIVIAPINGTKPDVAFLSATFDIQMDTGHIVDELFLVHE